VIDTGDTAWIIVASALVLFMMIPGLAMFYAGLVRNKNVLSVYMHCFTLTALVTVIWTIFGYSLAFDNAGLPEEGIGLHSFVGGFGKVFMSGVDADSVWGTIPEPLFFIFQMTFAIITPGLIVGAFAERMKLSAMLVFSGLWVVLVYFPSVYMVWGGGFLAQRGVIDFAGGIVVHLTAGVAALIAAVMVGQRKGYPATPMPPHNLPMTLTGTAMLWVGWFGFNGGSALGANGDAAMAIVVTQISPCVAASTWAGIEWIRNGKPSALGFATGAIAGLAAITPASGNVGALGAFVIGLSAGTICYWASTSLKRALGYDDALDVVGVHGFGGVVGTILVAFFASSALQGNLDDHNMLSQLGTQLLGLAVVGVWCAIVSFIILKLTDVVIGLRIDDDGEQMGLDLADHGESGYNM
jgi:Amt family ammonium transporter